MKIYCGLKRYFSLLFSWKFLKSSPTAGALHLIPTRLAPYKPNTWDILPPADATEQILLKNYMV